MGILLASGDALWTWSGDWRLLPCPLRKPSLVSCRDGRIAAVDNAAHLLWHGGQLLSCPHDAEALMFWRGLTLLLSSNTDCLSIADAAGWRVTAHVGMYPQGMCLLAEEVLVCGGADGLVHRLTLPDLLPVIAYPVPGMAQRIHADGDIAHVLSLTCDEPLQTLLCRIDLPSGMCTPVAQLPGIPGAVCTDKEGGAWVGSTESLCHYPAGTSRPDVFIPGAGLPTHLTLHDSTLLSTDPVAGQVTLLSADGAAHLLWQGEVADACFC